MKKQLEGRVFFLSYLQEQLTSELQDAPENAERAETREELRRMLATIEATELPLPSEEVRPVYSERSLFVSLQKAVKTFRDHWRGRLGLMVVSNIKKEHWKRIEALARRIAQWHTDEYDTLRPVADLIKDVSEQMRQFLEQPIRWEPSRSDSEEMRQAVVDTIARELHTRLHMLIRIRLITDHQPEWLTAYIRSGRGSAMVRAQDIDGIYRVAAPTFVEMAQVVNIEKLSFGTVHTLEEMLEEEKIDEFTVQVTGILKEAIQLKGGRLIRN